MVVSPSIAKPQLEHKAIEVADQLGGAIEAGALRLEAPDDAVEPAHSAGVAVLAPSLRRRTSNVAVLSCLFVLSRRWANSCMIETAMLGNSRTMRMNGSLAIRSATIRPFARTEALRGTSPRIAISPT